MKFSVGDEVLVNTDGPEKHGPAHIRTPHYVRGRRGRVVKELGVYPNPEDLAFARPASPRQLYHVTFAMRELWSDPSPNDELVVELYEHWLEPA